MITNWFYTLPEIFVLSMGVIILLLDLFFKSNKPNITYFLSQLTLIGSAILSLRLYHLPSTLVFSSTFILDPLASVLKIAIDIIMLLVFWFAKDYVKEKTIPYTEFYVLSLFAVLGMMVLVSAHNFIVLFLGVELSALPVYAMVALWKKSPNGSEAAIKYFVIGALASGMLLYGLSMLYGATGSLDISVISQSPHDLILVFGLVFVLASIAFKFGAAPFHSWVPDVYQGAPNAVTLLISTAPKIAALGMAFRLLVNALPVLEPQWQQVFIVIAIASMAVGNIAAIIQTNLKRMLAYSSIAQMGYMSLGLLSGNAAGDAAALFYILSYSIMVAGAFGLLTILSREGIEVENIQDLHGLNGRNPWLAFMLLLIMFSMAGIPPTVGFFAKMGVLEALIRVHLVWLATLALIFAIIGAYYYINVVKVMYFEEPKNQFPMRCNVQARVAISITGMSVLLLGIFPSGLINVCHAVFGS